MNLARLAINNSRITIMALVMAVLLGLATYANYPSAEDPTITIRKASVTASFPGMSPERVEQLIAVPIETAMREIAEIDEIRSTSKTGSVKVELDVRDDVADLEAVFQDIRNKADDVKPDLPEGTQGPFVNDEEGLTAIASVALWSDGFTMAEMRDVAQDTRDRLYSLEGVRRIDILGLQEERIYLDINPAILSQYELSPQEIFGALSQQNIVQPGGEITVGSRSIVIEPSGDLKSIDELKAVVFRIPETDRVLRLDEVAEIRRDYVDPPVNPAFFNNKPAIVLAVSTVEGTNNVAFGEDLTALLERIEQDLPIGYVLDYATFQPELIDTAINGAVSNVYQTLGIVLAVVMLFLGIRTGLIVGSFVPLTILVGIIVMRYFEVELQRMSIAATIIALGLLVDNGIVVAEDIRVRLEKGLDRLEAAAASVQSLAVPLLTSSMTTILAFVPMLLTEGSAGEYVNSLGQVVAILLLASWFLSMTVTPAMCAWFLKVPAKGAGGDAAPEDRFDGLLYRIYRRILETALRRRWMVIALMLALLFGSVKMLGTVRQEFFPLGERNQLLVYMDFEAGTNIEESERGLRVLTQWLSDRGENPEVTSNIAYVGFGGPRFFLALSPPDPDPHRAFVLVNTADYRDVDPLLDRINRFMDENIPAARGDAKKMWFGGTEPGVVEIRLTGPDSDILFDRGEALLEAFHQVPGTVGIKQDWENKVLKLQVTIDQTRARRAGVTSKEVAQALNAVFSGTAISDFREGDKIIPIVVRGEHEIRHAIAGLQAVRIYSASEGRAVNLGQVASVSADWQFGRIQRKDQQRTLTVEARNPHIASGELFAAVEPVITGLDLPAGYGWELGGELEDQANANSNLFGLLPIAFGGIVILLIGQFNSFRKGGIIIATIPLIMIGGTLGLVVMGAPYGFMVMLGFFSLAGILINNGIVLIDRIQTEEAAGLEPIDAVITACLSRFRPIMMTTLTTVLGLVPLILFGGALFYGMASAIAFGLIVGTVLTLCFVPALYTLFYRVSVKDVGDPARELP